MGHLLITHIDLLLRWKIGVAMKEVEEEEEKGKDLPAKEDCCVCS